MNKPWMPVVAGILDIVSGAVGVVMGLFMALPLHAARVAQAAPGAAQKIAPRVAPHLGAFPQMPHLFFPGMGLALGITIAVIGVLAIVGGIFALKNKVWGLALAGSIGAVLTGRLLGVLALIFIVLGRKDFEK
jgi:hypothetical protein